MPDEIPHFLHKLQLQGYYLIVTMDKQGLDEQTLIINRLGFITKDHYEAYVSAMNFKNLVIFGH